MSQSESNPRPGRTALTPEQREASGLPVKPKTGLKAPVALPDPPPVLYGIAEEEWNRAGRWLSDTQRVARLDKQLLTFYCASYSVFAGAAHRLLVGRNELWNERKGRPLASSLFTVAIRHGDLVLRSARKFGMTAKSRYLDGNASTPEEIRRLRGMSDRRKEHPPMHGHVPSELDAETQTPTWLKGTQAEVEWDRLTKQLSLLDLWTGGDVAPVSVACAVYALALEAVSQMQFQPLVLSYGNDNSSTEHPLLRIVRDSWSLCESIWSDYGMTPFDRQALSPQTIAQEGQPELKLFPGK